VTERDGAAGNDRRRRQRSFAHGRHAQTARRANLPQLGSVLFFVNQLDADPKSGA